MTVNARTFSTIVTVSQIANEGTLIRAGSVADASLARVRPSTTTVTTADSPSQSAKSHAAKVITNCKITDSEAFRTRATRALRGHARSQPARILPTTTRAAVGAASLKLNSPAATAPMAAR